METNKNYGVFFLPIEKIGLDEPYLPPIKDDELKLLTESIKENGIIYPLIVKKNKNGDYKLLDGFNRYRVAKILNFSEIPCVIADGVNEISAIYDSNLFRRHLDNDIFNKFLSKRNELNQLNKNDLAPQFKELEHILPEDVKKALKKIDIKIQSQIYNAIPERYKEDESKIKELKTQLDTATDNNVKLTNIIKELQLQINQLKKSENAYKKLSETREKDLKALINKKEEEIRKKYEEELTPVLLEQKIKEATAGLKAEYEKVISEKEKVISEQSKKRVEAEFKLKEYLEQEKKQDDDYKKLKDDYEKAVASKERMSTILKQLINIESFIKEANAVAKQLESSLSNIKTLRDRMIEMEYKTLVPTDIDGLKNAVKEIRPKLTSINNVLSEIEEFLKLKPFTK
ncbi:MAG TPA: ParB N-terminal domain-containing protein [Syntrophorhabdaceae bacterium]|nr:ParB N-terminal domain-containing protein [Caldisericia bacterium]HQH42575.1 ParB N-terminal domain-containing protein [Syntrophorhabdaceae bacterium]